MKRTLPILLALCLMLAACSSPRQSTPTPQSSRTPVGIRRPTPRPETPFPLSAYGALGDGGRSEAPASDFVEETPASVGEEYDTWGIVGAYSIGIRAAEMGQDEAGNECIIITYEWSHYNEGATSFAFSLVDDVTQDGVSCEPIYTVEGIDPEADAADIPPDTAHTVKKAYLLGNSTGEVSVAVWVAEDQGAGVVTHTFPLPL